MNQGQAIWFEIPVNDLDRAVDFYSNILQIKVKRILMLDQELGYLDKGDGTPGGVLIKKENYQPGQGSVLFFYVIDISQILKNLTEIKGTIITDKTLLKQKNSSGNFVISNNLIDQKVGYYAEIIDSEGNRIGLYSNS